MKSRDESILTILRMIIKRIFDALFHKKERMPIEPNGHALSNEREVRLNMDPIGEYVFLQEILLCDETHAVEIATNFEKITGKKLEKVELVPTEKKSKILKVETPDKTYYLKINSLNVLNKICEDSMAGNIIFQIIY